MESPFYKKIKPGRSKYFHMDITIFLLMISLNILTDGGHFDRIQEHFKMAALVQEVYGGHDIIPISLIWHPARGVDIFQVSKMNHQVSANGLASPSQSYQ